MVIVCEKCSTRFNLADDRIPPGGAKVRCSRCQHGFHVASPRSEQEPDPILSISDENSLSDASGAVWVGNEEPDLENPEFLYEPLPDSPDDPLLGAGEAEEYELGAEDEPLAEVEGEFLSGGPDATPDSPLGDSKFQPIDSPDGSASEDPLSRWDPFDEMSEQGPEVDPFGETESGGLLSAPITGIEHVPLDPGLYQAIPAVVDGLPGSVAETPEKKSRAGAVRFASDEFCLPALGGVFLRVLATCVGLLLLLAGAHVMEAYALRLQPGPAVVRGPGWQARGISARFVQDGAGREALLIEGMLQPTGTAAPPRVRVTLVGADHEPLARQLARVGPRAGAATSGLGFRALLPDPPIAAKRYHVGLEADTPTAPPGR